jgi:hypothetical protein
VVINHPVNPGDSMTGTVTYAAGGFTLTLTDNTGGWSFSTLQASKRAQRSSVEWIVEGPSSGTLTDFGTVPFSNDSASINGVSQTLDAFGSATNAITMTTKSGIVRAVPGSLSKNGAFSDTWQHG